MTSGSMPVLGVASFKCPHCGAIAHQDWYRLRADACRRGQAPFIPEEGYAERVGRSEGGRLDFPIDQALLNWTNRMRFGRLFFEQKEGRALEPEVQNIWLSRCFSCNELAVWVHDRVLFPTFQFDIPPNADLPEDIRADFIEAAKIVDLSPRGSAALLRLCVQKLCKHLGKPGRNINDDIGSLVSDGLDARIQKALDIVRVVGNGAVHPGLIDMTDDKRSAYALFQLVNVIAERMISIPKHIDTLYEEVVPDTARAQIAKRDEGAPN